MGACCAKNPTEQTILSKAEKIDNESKNQNQSEIITELTITISEIQNILKILSKQISFNSFMESVLLFIDTIYDYIDPIIEQYKRKNSIAFINQFIFKNMRINLQKIEDILSNNSTQQKYKQLTENNIEGIQIINLIKELEIVIKNIFGKGIEFHFPNLKFRNNSVISDSPLLISSGIISGFDNILLKIKDIEYQLVKEDKISLDFGSILAAEFWCKNFKKLNFTKIYINWIDFKICFLNYAQITIAKTLTDYEFEGIREIIDKDYEQIIHYKTFDKYFRNEWMLAKKRKNINYTKISENNKENTEFKLMYFANDKEETLLNIPFSSIIKFNNKGMIYYIKKEEKIIKNLYETSISFGSKGNDDFYIKMDAKEKNEKLCHFFFKQINNKFYLMNFSKFTPCKLLIEKNCYQVFEDDYLEYLNQYFRINKINDKKIEFEIYDLEINLIKTIDYYFENNNNNEFDQKEIDFYFYYEDSKCYVSKLKKENIKNKEMLFIILEKFLEKIEKLNNLDLDIPSKSYNLKHSDIINLNGNYFRIIGFIEK